MYLSTRSPRTALTAADCNERADQAERLARYLPQSADRDSYLAEAGFWRHAASNKTLLRSAA